jgi:hypothetical protein
VKWVLVSSGSPSSEFLRESAKDVPFLLKYVCVNLSVRGRFLIWCYQHQLSEGQVAMLR